MNSETPKKQMPDIFTVSEVTRYVKSLISSDPKLNNVYVKGEISNFKHHSSGHMYFVLKDEDESLLTCVMFKYANEELTFQPEDGMEVIVYGSFSVYEKRGQYQIIIKEMYPAGQGSLMISFKQLMKKLEKEGLFREEFKKKLPFLPKRIGIATSETGDALRDMVRAIKRRCPLVEIIFSPTIVQGDEGAPSIVKSIEILNEYPGIDVIIIGRGGGSIEDLWAFNEEIVARAIFNSKIPIISAVGHEPDVTISDYVADKRASTPTGAGEIVVPNKSDLIALIRENEIAIGTSLKKIIESNRSRLKQIALSAVFRRPSDRIHKLQQDLDIKVDKISISLRNRMQFFRKDLDSHEKRLNALNPKAVLGRGYSIVLKDKTILKDSANIRPAEQVNVILHKGDLLCKVEKVKKSKEA